jgi:hypothetical protein
MSVVGSGFGPGDTVEISSSDGSVGAMTTASAAGTIGFATGAPVPLFTAPGQKTVTLTAQDFTPAGAEITATAAVTAAPLAVSTKPARAKFTHRVTWMFSGFESGKSIFAHYLHKKPVATQKFGKATGPCGLLKARALLFPGGHPHFKSYRVQIDDAKRYNKNTSPRIDTKLGTFFF